MKKILITYASYGSGHKTIAEYIKEYIECDDYEIKIIDILDYTGKVVNSSLKLFDYVYNHRMETFFSLSYKSMDNLFLLDSYKLYFKLFIQNEKLKKIYTDFNPDIVLSTHFYGSNIAAYLKKENLINSKIITIVTDYKIHRFWMSSYDKDEIFIVANDIVKNNMIKRKCYTNNIYSFGLPYNEKLRINMLPKNQILDKYDIKDIKTILFFGGGSNGSEAYLKYLKNLAKINLDYQILFVCGKSENLKNKAEALARNYKNIKVFGFINNVYELLEVSDIVITKPGGATVTECLEMQKFMLLIPGIGGQEEYNARFVKKNNYGIYKKNIFTFHLYVLFNIKKTNNYKNNYNYSKKNNKSLENIKELIGNIK